MTNETRNTFKELYETDCSAHIEHKGGFSYLSWPFAVAQLRKRCPSATWEVKRFGQGEPFMCTAAGVFVEVAVTVDGITLSQIHPVLDNKNRPIAKPSAFDINTSIQRCLVKAIALHGLGLSIYAGEDVPQVEQGPAPTLTAEMVADMRKRILQAEADEMQFLAWLGAPSLEAIEQGDQHMRALQALDMKKKRLAEQRAQSTVDTEQPAQSTTDTETADTQSTTDTEQAAQSTVDTEPAPAEQQQEAPRRRRRAAAAE